MAGWPAKQVIDWFRAALANARWIGGLNPIECWLHPETHAAVVGAIGCRPWERGLRRLADGSAIIDGVYLLPDDEVPAGATEFV